MFLELNGYRPARASEHGGQACCLGLIWHNGKLDAPFMAFQFKDHRTGVHAQAAARAQVRINERFQVNSSPRAFANPYVLP